MNWRLVVPLAGFGLLVVFQHQLFAPKPVQHVPFEQQTPEEQAAARALIARMFDPAHLNRCCACPKDSDGW
jgi:hypothetical protein